MINHSFKVGVSFGMMSGIITTLGLMVGMHSGTHSKSAILGAILIIAVADAFSDALGIHISEEAENVHTNKEVWISTISTFVSKFLFSSIFIFPVLFLELKTAIYASVMIGLSLIVIISYFLALQQNVSPYKIIFEHIVTVCIVVYCTHLIGNWVGAHFG